MDEVLKRPRSFELGACEICARPTVDGRCAHCGHPIPSRGENAAVATPATTSGFAPIVAPVEDDPGE